MTWGIYCIETVWDRESNWSALPLLEMMRSRWDADFIHRNAVTRDEFFRHLASWCDDHYDYPVLYLGYHGSAGELWLDDYEERAVENRIDLRDVSAGIEQRCENTMIHFSSCATMDVDGPELVQLLKDTGASGVSGYSMDVDWMGSAAFEMLYLDILQTVKDEHGNIRNLTPERAPDIRGYLNRKPYTFLRRELGFKLKVA